MIVVSEQPVREGPCPYRHLRPQSSLRFSAGLCSGSACLAAPSHPLCANQGAHHARPLLTLSGQATLNLSPSSQGTHVLDDLDRTLNPTSVLQGVS